MSPRAKKILIVSLVVLATGILACVVAGIAGASWMQQWVREVGEQGQQVQDEARGFAAGHDQDACVAEGLRRTDGCGEQEIMCGVNAGVFFDACLDAAAPVPGFCDGVPPGLEIMQTAQWMAAHCVELGRAGDPRCTRLLQAMSRHCDRARP